MTGRVIVGLLWLTMLIVVAGAWSAGASSVEKPGISLLEPVAPTPPRVDLYGNEVENAIGDYRIDFDGEVYERHSPDTEVARLGSPST
jgi:hypothetical protein